MTLQRWTAWVVLACATLSCAKFQSLDVVSDPPGAEIYVDGELVGTTPMKLRVDRLEHHKVFLKKAGYRPELVILELHPEPDGVDYLTPPDVRARLQRPSESGGEDALRIELESEDSQNDD